jgi:hypothetical protein
MGVIAVGLLMAVAACGSGSTGISQGSSGSPKPASPANPHSIQIAKIGFGTSDFSTTAVAVIVNTSKTDAALLVQVQMSAYDSQNGVVGSGDNIVYFMRAGEQTAVAVPIQVSQGAKVSEIKAQASPQQWTKDLHPEATIGSSGVKYSAGEFGLNQVTGSIVSHYQSNLKDLSTTAVCYDANGSIVGGGIGLLQLLPGGGQVGTSVSVTTTTSPTTCELYADQNAGSASP